MTTETELVSDPMLQTEPDLPKKKKKKVKKPKKKKELKKPEIVEEEEDIYAEKTLDEMNKLVKVYQKRIR